MSVEIQIPVALARYTGNQESLKLSGASVEEAIRNLTSQFPSLKNHLLDKKGEIRPFVNIYVNDQDIRHGKQMKTALKSGDVVTIVPSIAGGNK
ncbi:MAG: MoaD/ThiS family protein [Candidatus Omnitrophica bacterium]|nr:MoaD/ThiS family protein [Candidatus Omnitrophota bacterium]